MAYLDYHPAWIMGAAPTRVERQHIKHKPESPAYVSSPDNLSKLRHPNTAQPIFGTPPAYLTGAMFRFTVQRYA